MIDLILKLVHIQHGIFTIPTFHVSLYSRSYIVRSSLYGIIMPCPVSMFYMSFYFSLFQLLENEKLKVRVHCLLVAVTSLGFINSVCVLINLTYKSVSSCTIEINRLSFFF